MDENVNSAFKVTVPLKSYLWLTDEQLFTIKLTSDTPDKFLANELRKHL